MEIQEILEYNKMCAEFLEYEFDELSETYETPHLKLVEPHAFGDEQFSCKLKIYELDFHSDWNWIMEVVEKIYSLNIYYDKYKPFNSSQFTNGEVELTTNKEAVVEAINKFLIWYNKNK